MHHDTITISKSHSILMNFIDFYKTRLPLPNITALSNISFATILTDMFAKTEILFVFTTCGFRQKKLQNGITAGENLQGQKLWKLDKVPSGAHIPPTSATATF